MGDGDVEAAVLSPARALQSLVEGVVADDGPATRRLRELRQLQEDLTGLLDRARRAAWVVQIEDDSMPAHVRRDLLTLRESADLREELLARHLYEPGTLDEMGLLSHEDIDRCIENDVLEEAISIGGLVGGALSRFNQIHTRGRGGRFADKPGTPSPPKGRPGAKRAPIFRQVGKPRPSSPRKQQPQRPGHAGGGPRFTRMAEVKDHPDVGKVVKGSTVKKVLRDAAGNEWPVYETQPATAQEILDAVNAGVDHPSLSLQARSSLRERKHGKGNEPGQRVTKAEAEKRGLADQAKGQTAEEERARQYEQRKEALTQRVAGEVASGTASDAATGGTDWNDNERVSQARLLRFAREASSTPTTAEEHAALDENGDYVLDPDGNTVFDADRGQLHEEIADLFLRKRRRVATGKTDSEGNPEYRYELCPECDYMEGSADPQVLFSGGGYSSGKGGVVDRLIAEMDGTNTLVLDPDQIKALLPEFAETLEGDPEANLRVFEESWAISQVIQRVAQRRKLNVVVDGVSDGHADEMLARVDQFQAAGYSKPRVVYVDIPTEEAMKRAAARAKKAKKPSDRRHIPEPIMRAVHRDVAATIPGVIDGAAQRGLRVEVWDNDQGQAADGSFNPPRRFVNVDPSNPSDFIEDPQLWQRLREKAEEAIPGVAGELPPLPERVRTLVDRARELGIDKWPPDKDAEAERIIPPGFFDTQEMFAERNQDNATEYNPEAWDYDPAREKAVHDPIVEKLLEGVEPADGTPRILYITGGMASGKGTALAQMEERGLAPPGAAKLDPDGVKELMPEFREGLDGNPYGGTALHRESTVILDKAWKEAQKRGLNLIIDSSGGGWPPGWLKAQLEDQRAAGYEAEVVMVDVPTPMAIERSMTRAVDEGRFVPLRRLQENHATVSARLQELIDLDWLPLRLYSNSQRAFDLEQSQMAMREPGGKLDVKRPVEFAEWKAKAEREPQQGRTR